MLSTQIFVAGCIKSMTTSGIGAFHNERISREKMSRFRKQLNAAFSEEVERGRQFKLSSGLDGTSAIVIKSCAPELSPILTPSISYLLY